MHLTSIIITFAAARCASAAILTDRASCHQDPNTNLIKNGNFEGKTIKPWEPYNKKAGIVKPGHNSAQAGGSIGKNETLVSFLKQAIDVCPGSFYVLSWDQKVISNKPSGHGTVNQVSAQGAETFLPFGFSTPQHGEWQHHSMIFHANYNKKKVDVQFSYNIENANLAAFDNVKVYPLGPTSVKKGAPELLSNGGFESGKYAPWIEEHPQACGIVKDGYKSEYAVKCEIPGNSVDNAELRYYNVTFEVGKRYILSYDMKQVKQRKADDCPSRPAFFDSYDFGPVSGAPADGVAADFPFRNNTWVHYKVPFIAVVDKDIFHMTNDATFNTRACSWTMDNFSMKEAA